MDIGTNKEKMVTLDGPDFPISIGQGLWVGRRYIALMQTGYLMGFLCKEGQRGREDIGLLLLYIE